MILALFLACSGPRAAAELPASDAPAPLADPVSTVADPVSTVADPVSTVAELGGAAEPAPLGDAKPTPAQSYAACKDRLEGPQAAGECTTDAECVTVGCSSEVCTATTKAPDVMTTCEILPCFSAVEGCGCHEGMCTWNVRSEMPAPRHLQLPKKP